MLLGSFEHDEPDKVVDDAESKDLLSDIVGRFRPQDLHVQVSLAYRA